MREIKFRAIANTGEWVYGNFIHSKRFEGCSNEFRIHDPFTGMEHDIIIETLGQYVGFEDDNGVEIYENDTVKISNSFVGTVKYKDGSFIIQNEAQMFFYMNEFVSHLSYEVIYE